MRLHSFIRQRGLHQPGRHFAGLGPVAIVPAVALLWLLVGAIPVFADGGPHVQSINGGSGGLTADSCAGCHRAHTSQSPTGMLLTSSAPTVTAFCRSCHGAAGTGAATDVDTGVQYGLASDSTRTGTQIGALRGGGFIQARIGSADAYRTRISVVGTREFVATVPVGPAGATTSAHLALASGLTATNTAWGYGPIAPSNPGTLYTGGLECTSCHNPHGNGQYRILNPLPADDATTGGVKPTIPAPVYDPPLPAGGDNRNYTVIQVKGTTGTNSSFLLYASQLGPYSATSGDYFHRFVPWNDSAGGNDAPNGRAANGIVDGTNVLAFNTQMTTWCTQCHTRYFNTDGPSSFTGDGIFSYQHMTTPTGTNRLACTTCHVAHGSNAVMNTDPSVGTTFSANEPYPASPSATSGDLVIHVGDSRLLKFNGRGTCLACHDPTNTVAVGQSQGTPPGTPPTPPSTGTLSGTVTASGGGAISGATVSVSGGPSTTTNASGAYSLSGVATGTRSVTASATGYTSSTLSVSIVAGSNTQNFTLTSTGGGGPTTGTISGTVTASGGGAINGATVTISGGASTTTNSSGAYSFSGLTPATYSLTASATGYTTSSPASVTVTAGGTTTQDFALTATTTTPGTLQGTITNNFGGRVFAATVTITGGATRTTDGAGFYQFTGLAPGTYTVTASAPSYLSSSATAVVTSGGTTTQNLMITFSP